MCGNPPSPFNHFDSTFSRIPVQPSKLPFFAGMTTAQGKLTAPINALCYPTIPPPRHRVLPHLPLTPPPR